MKISSFSKYNFIIFLFWPLLALIKAFKIRQYSFLKVWLPIFTGVLGYTYNPAEGADINLPIDTFETFIKLNFSGKINFLIINKLSNLLDSGIELYVDLTAFVVSLFTDNYRWVLFVLGYIYGLILYNFFKELTLYKPKFNTWFYKLLLFFVVLFIQPSMAMNGRFWLATLLFLYLAMAYFNNPKLKFILLSGLCLLIHKGFLLAIVLFLIWHFLKRIKARKYIFLSILFLSIITPESLMLNVIRENKEDVGETYSKQIEGYTREKYIEIQSKVGESRSLLFNIYSKRYIILFYASSFFLLYLYIKKYYKKTDALEDFFYLIILFISFSNFFIGVPSLGSRYRFIAVGLMLVFFLKIVEIQRIKPYKLPSIVLVLSLAFGFIISLRMEFEQLYAFSYILNPALSFLLVEDMSVMELIRSII